MRMLIILTLVLAFGCQEKDIAKGDVIGVRYDEFEKRCRDQGMNISSSPGIMRLYLRGERREFKEIHCSGNGQAGANIDAYSLDGLVYSTERTTALGGDSTGFNGLNVDGVRMTENGNGKQIVIDFEPLIKGGIISRESAMWELGPYYVKAGKGFPQFFREPLNTFGNVSIGMGIDAFKIAMKDLGRSCDIAPHPSAKAIETARRMPHQDLVSCSKSGDFRAVFSDGQLYYFRLETNITPKGNDTSSMIYRLALRAASPSTAETVPPSPMYAAPLEDKSEDFFFGSHTVLSRFGDDKRYYVIFGDALVARNLCLQQIYEATNNIEEMHPMCRYVGRLTNLFPCPSGTKYESSSDEVEGRFVHAEHCLNSSGDMTSFRVWLQGAKGVYVAKEKDADRAEVECYADGGARLACEKVDQLFAVE